MAASAAITLAVKAAAVAVTDKRARTAIASVIAAVFLPFILMIFVILSALDGTSTHNFSAVDLAFHGGVLPAEVPEEYREYIEDIRNSFQSLDSLIAGVENLEGGPVDASRVKAYFYALYFGEEQPSRRAQNAFLECFLRYEERTREVEGEDGSITEETYTVAIFLTDQEEICSNLESLLGRTLTMEDRANAQRIYTTAVYGRVGPGSFEAGKEAWADVLGAKVVRVFQGYSGLQMELSGVKASRLDAFSAMLAGYCSVEDYENWVNEPEEEAMAPVIQEG